jgi:hypothetical protein
MCRPPQPLAEITLHFIMIMTFIPSLLYTDNDSTSQETHEYPFTTCYGDSLTLLYLWFNNPFFGTLWLLSFFILYTVWTGISLSSGHYLLTGQRKQNKHAYIRVFIGIQTHGLSV